jgi:RHS repeat-associated protein
LQFISHEEGRARWAFHKYTTGTTAYKLEYDFFEKDHLGNIRMVLTQQRDTANYLASMEAAYRATESQLFANITTTGYPRASVAGYPNSTTITNPNDSVSKVDYNGTSGQKTGPSLLLKVMSGDTITMAVQSYYNTNTATMTNSSFSNVLSSLAAGLVSTAAGNAEGTLSGFTATTSPVYTGLNSFLTTNDPAAPAGYPKAYLNWIFLDDQFNYVSSSSGSVPAANSSHPAATLNTIAPGSPLNIAKNGYLYVWVSNETQNWDVFFDNLSVQHKQGAVLEEDHYYPFGLTMAGISDRAIKSQYPINKYLFNNGRELQNREFSDGNGLELYDAVHRMYDHQLGRFGQIDPLTDFTPNNSGYMYVGDNPMLYCDPLGLDTIKIFGEGEHHLKIKKGDVLSWQIGNNTSYYTYDPTNKDAVGGFVGEGIKEDYSRAVTVTPSAEQEAKRDQQKQEGAGFPWAASIGSGFSTADYGMFNEKTWFSLKKWQSYSQSWGGNGATGGKFKMAEKWAKGFRYTGWAFGAFNAVSIYRDKDMSGAQKWIEQGSNTFGTFGGIWGVAHTIGWESGRAISNNDWYRTNVRPVLQDALGVQRDEFLKLNYNIDAIGNTNNQ